MLAATPWEGLTRNDVLFSEVIELCGLPGQSEAFQAFCEASILDLDPDGVFLQDVSLLSLFFGDTKLSEIPLPEGVTWCDLTGESGSDPDVGFCNWSEANLLLLDLAGFDVGGVPWSQIPADSVDYAPDSFLGALLDDPSTPAEDPIFRLEPGESVLDYVSALLDPVAFPWSQLDVRGIPGLSDFALRRTGRDLDDVVDERESRRDHRDRRRARRFRIRAVLGDGHRR